MKIGDLVEARGGEKCLGIVVGFFEQYDGYWHPVIQFFTGEMAGSKSWAHRDNCEVINECR